MIWREYKDEVIKPVDRNEDRETGMSVSGSTFKQITLNVGCMGREIVPDKKKELVRIEILEDYLFLSKCATQESSYSTACLPPH